MLTSTTNEKGLSVLYIIELAKIGGGGGGGSFVYHHDSVLFTLLPCS